MRIEKILVYWKLIISFAVVYCKSTKSVSLNYQIDISNPHSFNSAIYKIQMPSKDLIDIHFSTGEFISLDKFFKIENSFVIRQNTTFQQFHYFNETLMTVITKEKQEILIYSKNSASVLHSITNPMEVYFAKIVEFDGSQKLVLTVDETYIFEYNVNSQFKKIFFDLSTIDPSDTFDWSLDINETFSLHCTKKGTIYMMNYTVKTSGTNHSVNTKIEMMKSVSFRIKRLFMIINSGIDYMVVFGTGKQLQIIQISTGYPQIPYNSSLAGKELLWVQQISNGPIYFIYSDHQALVEFLPNNHLKLSSIITASYPFSLLEVNLLNQFPNKVAGIFFQSESDKIYKWSQCLGNYEVQGSNNCKSYNCTDINCLKCPFDKGICSNCMTGFILLQSQCVENQCGIMYCSVCNNQGVCTNCAPSYAVDSNGRCSLISSMNGGQNNSQVNSTSNILPVSLSNISQVGVPPVIPVIPNQNNQNTSGSAGSNSTEAANIANNNGAMASNNATGHQNSSANSTNNQSINNQSSNSNNNNSNSSQVSNSTNNQTNVSSTTTTNETSQTQPKINETLSNNPQIQNQTNYNNSATNQSIQTNNSSTNQAKNTTNSVPEITNSSSIESDVIDFGKDFISLKYEATQAEIKTIAQSSKAINSIPLMRNFLKFLMPFFAFFDDYWYYIYHDNGFYQLQDVPGLLVIMYNINGARLLPEFISFDQLQSKYEIKNAFDSNYGNYTNNQIMKVNQEQTFFLKNMSDMICYQYILTLGVFIIIKFISKLYLTAHTKYYQLNKVADQQIHSNTLENSPSIHSQEGFFYNLMRKLEYQTEWYNLLTCFIENNLIILAFEVGLEFGQFFSFNLSDKFNLIVSVLYGFLCIFYAFAFYFIIYQKPKHQAQSFSQISGKGVSSFTLFNYIQMYFVCLKCLLFGFAHSIFIENNYFQLIALIVARIILIQFAIKFAIKFYFVKRYLLKFIALAIYFFMGIGFDLLLFMSKMNLQKIIQVEKQTMNIIEDVAYFGLLGSVALQILTYIIDFAIQLFKSSKNRISIAFFITNSYINEHMSSPIFQNKAKDDRFEKSEPIDITLSKTKNSIPVQILNGYSSQFSSQSQHLKQNQLKTRTAELFLFKSRFHNNQYKQNFTDRVHQTNGLGESNIEQKYLSKTSQPMKQNKRLLNLKFKFLKNHQQKKELIIQSTIKLKKPKLSSLY